MQREQLNWRNALIALGALALLTIGLGIIVYVGLARERISPTPTPIVARATLPGASATPSLPPTAAARVLGVVREYSPGALIIVLTPSEGTVEQIIVVENVQVLSSDGALASPRDIVPGATILAEGTLDALGRMIASRIVISQGPPPTATHTVLPPTATLTGVPAVTATATPVSSIPVRAWLSEYFSNPSLQGAPTVVRTDAAIDFQWGQGAPALGIARDRFSVRWRGRWPLEEGGYRLYAYADDGIRVWVDGVIVIDNWKDQGPTLSYGDQYLATGEHTIQVEYYDQVENAQARVWWEFKGLYPDWRGEYYPNRNLTGAPVLTRNDVTINFDWGPGSPGPSVPADNHSVRWTRTMEMEGGSYRFYARADDGVRLWVDGPLIIDEWHDSQAKTYSGDIYLDGGPHSLRVEYYEAAGRAGIQVWWERIDQFTDWMGEYFANGQLSGRPAFVRNDANIDMNWGTGSPGSGVPADDFSVRWTRKIPLETANYRLWIVADDGARVLVNGGVLIDAWTGSAGVLREAQYAATSGTYNVVVEYHEVTGGASMRMGLEKLTPPTSTATVEPLFLVTYIVDGDTIDVEIGGATYRVRYIGIDTPERGDCYFDEAMNKNSELVMGQYVRLVKDVSETDRYGRLLRYVYVGETFVNYEMVWQGYALASTYPPDVAHAQGFAQAQHEAQEANRGLWAGCFIPTPTATATQTPTGTPTTAATLTPTVAPPTVVPPTVVPTATAAPTATEAPTATSVVGPTPTATEAPAVTPTPTVTPTGSAAPSVVGPAR